MAGLVPAIHVFPAAKTWIPGTSPGMASFTWSADFRYTSAFSRRKAPELCKNLSPPRGERGMPGARCTRSLMRKV